MEDREYQYLYSDAEGFHFMNPESYEQIAVAADVAAQVAAGDARIMGVMIESHLEEGRQDIVAGQQLKPGVSVTDACISFAQTVPVLDGLAEAVRARRSKRG